MAKITNKAVLETIAALEAELTDISSLAKAEGPPPEGTDDSASASPSAEGPAEGPPEATEAPPEAPAEAPAAAPAQDPAAAAQGPLDPEALKAEYSQLPPDELQMHIQCATEALQALQGAAGAGMGAPAGSPPPMAPPAGSPPPMGKSQLPVDKKANGGMVKSESNSEVAMLKAEIASAGEDIALLTKAVTMVMSQPTRKAVTGIAQLQYLNKSEGAATKTQTTFTKAEVDAKLNALLPTLSKAERNTVVQYSLGRVKVDALESILEKVK